MISTETAYKLKAAGFPQPAPEVGQFWYLGEHIQFIPCAETGTGRPIVMTLGAHFFKTLTDTQFIQHCAYCPTPGDIIAQLPEDFEVRYGVPLERSHPDFAKTHDQALAETLAKEWLNENEVYLSSAVYSYSTLKAK